MIDQAIWGQILLTFATGFVSLSGSIVGFILWRSRTNLMRKLEQQQADNDKTKADAQAAVIKAQAQAQERVLAAEADIRNISEQHAVMKQLLQLLTDSGRRADEKDARDRAVLTQLLDTMRESTDTLKLHNVHMLNLLGDMNAVKTNLGESIRVLTLVEQVVSALPTQFDSRTNPIIESVSLMLKRLDELIDRLPNAQQQLIRDIIEAIRDVQSEAVRETVSVLLAQNPPTPKSIEAHNET
jgi:hypothetical protein